VEKKIILDKAISPVMQCAKKKKKPTKKFLTTFVGVECMLASEKKVPLPPRFKVDNVCFGFPKKKKLDPA